MKFSILQVINYQFVLQFKDFKTLFVFLNIGQFLAFCTIDSTECM